jgi:hypothetical protein
MTAACPNSPKQQLQDYRALIRAIRVKEQVALTLYNRLYALPSSVEQEHSMFFEDMKPDLLATIETLSAELGAMQESRRIKLIGISKMLERLGAGKSRQVLECRYLYAMDWEDVALAVYDCADDLKQCLKRYIKRCQDIHGEAMGALDGA